MTRARPSKCHSSTVVHLIRGGFRFCHINHFSSRRVHISAPRRASSPFARTLRVCGLSLEIIFIDFLSLALNERRVATIMPDIFCGGKDDVKRHKPVKLGRPLSP